MASPKYTYESPMAVDVKNDLISMVFTGGDLDCECLKFTKNPDDTFKLEVDKMMITLKDVGTYQITVHMTDSAFSES